ncbi:ADP-sugar pyrophosphatase-like [Mizuhopecten yessoensis]|uniref:ADP-sugar pyrophosphatase-like n=1 Tax=Mizuhopecten yessoensis TaxID=6573 RepID=UPI000B459F08|nr:ADP-sugar pyrophosphatase-like [Mizuhopecten yessoensis]
MIGLVGSVISRNVSIALSKSKLTSTFFLSVSTRRIMDAPTSVPCFVKEEEVARCKWLALSRITYMDAKGKERLWEAAKRTTTSDSGGDAVCVIAVLKRLLKFDCLVLVKQYRPPMKGYTLEMPAGLIDKNETAEQTAVRELKEETGYKATVKHSSPFTCMDAGTENATVQVVTAEIDGDTDDNKNPQTNPEESEFIEVVHVPMNDLLGKLNEFAKSGVCVDSRLYSYAIGMEMSKGHPQSHTVDT